MGIARYFFSAILLAAVGLATFEAASAQELVSSDASGNPLLEQGVPDSTYKLEDLTPDGRYVLFSSRTCNLYRKDRSNGELLLVLENTLTDSGGYSWCNGAGISADGNLVAASPTQHVAEPELVASGPDGSVVYSFGLVTEVLRKTLNTDQIVEIRRELTTTSANEVVRLELGNGCCYAAAFRDLAYDGATALVSDSAGFGFGPGGTAVAPAFRLVDIAAGSITPILLPEPGDEAQPIIVDAKMSRDGERVLLQTATVSAAAEQPEGPTGPGVICPQLGRCDVIGVPPEGCAEPVGSWWCFGQELPEIQRELAIYEVATGATRVIYTLDSESRLSLAAAGISGDGRLAFLVLSSPVCLAGPFSPPCPELSETDAAMIGLHRLTLDAGDLATTIASIPSLCDSLSLEDTDRCEALSIADDGGRLLVGVRTGNTPVYVPGPLPLPTGTSTEGLDANLPSSLNNFFGGQYSSEDLLVDNQYNKQIICLFTGTTPEPCVSGAYTPAIYYPGPVYRWYLADVASGHTQMVSIFDGGLVQAGASRLAGNGLNWAFSSAADFDANTGEDLAWLPGGRVYADNAGKTIDLAVMTRRLPPRADDTGIRLKTIVSNYGSNAANFVAVDFTISKPGTGTAGEPEVALDYDGCDIYDNTAYNRNGYPLTTEGGELEQNGRHFTLRCAVGLLGAGQRFTINWQISNTGNAPLQIRSRVEGNEADGNPRNNKRRISIANGSQPPLTPAR
ncbi:MAG: hypothetical protein P8X53_13655 [Chromatiales bacterium]